MQSAKCEVRNKIIFSFQLRTPNSALRTLFFSALHRHIDAAGLAAIVSDVFGRRPIKGRLPLRFPEFFLDDVRGPARDPRHSEDRSHEIGRDAHQMIDRCTVEIDIRLYGGLPALLEL